MRNPIKSALNLGFLKKLCRAISRWQHFYFLEKYNDLWAAIKGIDKNIDVQIPKLW